MKLPSQFNTILIIVLITLFPALINAQNETIKYNISLFGVLSTGTYSPCKVISLEKYQQIP